MKSSEIEILTPAEFARLLENASDETLPYWAIGGFTGLRTAELERLHWAEIHFDSDLVEVKAKNSKTASRGFVPIRPALKEWLAPYYLAACMRSNQYRRIGYSTTRVTPKNPTFSTFYK